jgi:serine protease Do
MQDRAEELRQVAANAAPRVVRIGRGLGRGAGLVVGPDRVATNAHNLRGEQATVTFADGRSATGRVLGADLDADLAVLGVATGDAAGPRWATVELGDEVVAVTLDPVAGVRVTTGRVSAVGAAFRSPRGRLVAEAIEHTAPLARGSSGGPLLDRAGRVVGINTSRRGDGFYLAVPADEALRQRLEALTEGTTPARARLGVAVAPPEVARRLRDAVGLPERDGLLVRGVEEDGPAERAGVRRGDLLVAAGDVPLRTSDDLFAVLDALEPGASLPLTVVRGTEELSLTAAFPA